MAGESVKVKAESKKVLEDKQRTCFVIMPIADHPDYQVGHFTRVYEHIIKPACIKAGFTPYRADDAQHTHVIMMDILQRILDADIAICDLSSRNPNVMYELGIRQAFDKPVTLIKDDKTARVFDTGMLSDVEYFSDLRIDNVQQAIESVAIRLQNTYDKKDEQTNSLIQLMRIEPAKPQEQTAVSPDTGVVLEAIAMLGRRVSALASLPNIDRQQRPMSQIESMIHRRTSLISESVALTSGIARLKATLESIGDGLVNVPIREQAEMELRHYEIALQELYNKIQDIELSLKGN